VGEDDTARRLARELWDAGVLASPVTFPTVATGRARVRLIVTSEHGEADLSEALGAFETVAHKLRLAG
jgi:glycine C-acetyltransferase